ncbi:MAG: primosomal protein N' [Anaerovoracaceae bacterium]
MKYVNIAIDNKSDYTDMLYTYGTTQEDICPGKKVYVTFGLGKKLWEAYVFQVMDEPEQEFKRLKYIEEIDPDISLTQEMLDTCIWMKKRYLCRYIDAIKCFTPVGKKPKAGKEKNPYKGAEGENQNIKELTQEQKQVLIPILEATKKNEHKRFLLHGITGSGKTEVYMQAIDGSLKAGKTAIMLVPEISLTTQIIDRFIYRFGGENIAVLHSKLTLRERYDEWTRIRADKVKIVIGARSAVFAPLKNIGIIILDEEHESTYKSDMSPKYDTVEVAIKRLMAHKGILVLGSATPSISSYHRAEKGIYEKLELTKRYNEVPLPKVDVVDMRKELRAGNKTMFSRDLHHAMGVALGEKQQIILFLNRRGYSTFISCRECGYVDKCPHCGVSLTYHKNTGKAICHYCGYTKVPSRICPECGSKYIRYFGVGTEQVEESCKELFPEAKVARLDLDAVKAKGSLNKLLNDVKKGRIDILIGTQLVAKGLDFRNVGLVGIVSADVSLNIPDFRSPEQTFQLITQASGRAGRGDKEGKVIIQAYAPDNYAISLAAQQDYKKFYETEIMLRNYMKYPPFGDLIQLVFTGKQEAAAKGAAENWYRTLLTQLGSREAENILPPQQAYRNKIKETYRYGLLVKCPLGKREQYTEVLMKIKGKELEVKKKGYEVSIDFNPYSFA